jgi:WD40 repeat protein
VHFCQNGKTVAVYERWCWMISSQMSDGSRIDGIINQDNSMTISLWEYKSGTELADLACQSDPLAIAKFSVDGRLLASGPCTGTSRTWLSKHGALQHTLNEHANAVTDVGFSHSGHILGYSSQSNRSKSGACAKESYCTEYAFRVDEFVSGIVGPIVDRRPSPPEVITDITTF